MADFEFDNPAFDPGDVDDDYVDDETPLVDPADDNMGGPKCNALMV